MQIKIKEQGKANPKEGERRETFRGSVKKAKIIGRIMIRVAAVKTVPKVKAEAEETTKERPTVGNRTDQLTPLPIARKRNGVRTECDVTRCETMAIALKCMSHGKSRKLSKKGRQ